MIVAKQRKDKYKALDFLDPGVKDVNMFNPSKEKQTNNLYIK